MHRLPRFIGLAYRAGVNFCAAVDPKTDFLKEWTIEGKIEKFCGRSGSGVEKPRTRRSSN